MARLPLLFGYMLSPLGQHNKLPKYHNTHFPNEQKEITINVLMNKWRHKWLPWCYAKRNVMVLYYTHRFSRKLAVSDLYKLNEVLAVRDQGGSHLVCLLPSGQARQSPLGSSQSHDGSSASGSPVVFEELEYHEPVCRQHHSQRVFRYGALGSPPPEVTVGGFPAASFVICLDSESDFDADSYKIPFVALSLKPFAAQVHSLLQTHEGTVPLLR